MEKGNEQIIVFKEYPIDSDDDGRIVAILKFKTKKTLELLKSEWAEEIQNRLKKHPDFHKNNPKNNNVIRKIYKEYKLHEYKFMEYVKEFYVYESLEYSETYLDF